MANVTRPLTPTHASLTPVTNIPLRKFLLLQETAILFLSARQAYCAPATVAVHSATTQTYIYIPGIYYMLRSMYMYIYQVYINQASPPAPVSRPVRARSCRESGCRFS